VQKYNFLSFALIFSSKYQKKEMKF